MDLGCEKLAEVCIYDFMAKQLKSPKSILENHNCIITGASRGLGARLASSFWDAGANLMLVSRSLVELRNIANALPERKKQTKLLLEVDLGKDDAPQYVIYNAKKAFGNLEVLVNNASIQGPIGPAWTLNWVDWKETLQVDLLAPILLSRLCVEWMIRFGHGKIINISGGGATGPRPNFSAYATAKTALVRFSEILAIEVQKTGIEVNCIAPGTMNTSLLNTILDAGPEVAGKDEYQKALTNHPQSTIERAVALCIFLASEASNGISGKLISAQWDPWESFPQNLDELRSKDIYTLRRILPEHPTKDPG